MAVVINPLKLGIPRCYGDDPFEIERLISELNKQQKIQDWTDRQVRQNLYFSLLGAAQIWYEREEARLEEMTWPQIRDALRVRFPPKAGRTYLTAFMRRVQEPKENIESYFEDKCRLKDLGCGGLDEETVIELIIDGLKDDAREAILMLNNTTLDELNANIIKVGRAKAQRVSNSVHDDTKRLESMVLNLRERLDSIISPKPAPVPRPKADNPPLEQLLVAALSQIANKAGNRDMICYRGQEQGHFANQCAAQERTGDYIDNSQTFRSASKFGNNGNRSRQHSRERSESRQPVCQICDAVGHTALGCPTIQSEIMSNDQFEITATPPPDLGQTRVQLVTESKSRVITEEDSHIGKLTTRLENSLPQQHQSTTPPMPPTLQQKVAYCGLLEVSSPHSLNFKPKSVELPQLCDSGQFDRNLGDFSDQISQISGRKRKALDCYQLDNFVRLNCDTAGQAKMMKYDEPLSVPHDNVSQKEVKQKISAQSCAEFSNSPICEHESVDEFPKNQKISECRPTPSWPNFVPPLWLQPTFKSVTVHQERPVEKVQQRSLTVDLLNCNAIEVDQIDKNKIKLIKLSTVQPCWEEELNCLKKQRMPLKNSNCVAISAKMPRISQGQFGNLAKKWDLPIALPLFEVKSLKNFQPVALFSSRNIACLFSNRISSPIDFTLKKIAIELSLNNPLTISNLFLPSHLPRTTILSKTDTNPLFEPEKVANLSHIYPLFRRRSEARRCQVFRRCKYRSQHRRFRYRITAEYLGQVLKAERMVMVNRARIMRYMFPTSRKRKKKKTMGKYKFYSEK